MVIGDGAWQAGDREVQLTGPGSKPLLCQSLSDSPFQEKDLYCVKAEGSSYFLKERFS